MPKYQDKLFTTGEKNLELEFETESEAGSSFGTDADRTRSPRLRLRDEEDVHVGLHHEYDDGADIALDSESETEGHVVSLNFWKCPQSYIVDIVLF